MAKLKYNSKGVDRSKETDFTPPKPGVYPMKIESATHEKDAGRIVFVARMTGPDGDGNGKGYGFWDYVPMDLDWKLDNWLVAVGIDTENNPEGEFDVPKDFVGKTIMGRVKSEFYVRSEGAEPEYKPKLARPLPFVEGDTGDGDEVDESEFDEDVEAEEEADTGEIEMPTKDEVIELGTMGDEGDDDAIITLNTLAIGAGLDPDEYETWSALAEEIAETIKPPKPAKKAAGKKAAAPVKKAAKKAAAPEPDEDEGEDYESWELNDLKAELESRNLSSKGPKSALIVRLRTADEDPFAE